MLRFFASDWNEIVRDLQWLSNSINPEVLDALMHTDQREAITDPLSRVAAACTLLGLHFSASYANEMIVAVREAPSFNQYLSLSAPAQLDSYLKPGNFEREIATLKKRIDDELRGREFFTLAPDRKQYFETPNLFGSEVATAFPAATVDIEEAGKCLALGRYTACVFHLMRVMEHGLRALANYLGVAQDFKTWDPIIRKMRSEVENYNTSTFKGNLDFIRQLLERLTAVQLALRNEVMHARSFYDEERADDVYRAVRTFMQQLATQLKEVT